MNDGNYPAPGPNESAQPHPPLGYGYPPGQYGPPAQWGYPVPPTPSSGLRVAAGVLGIVLGLVEFLAAGGAASMARFFPWLGFVALLDIVAAFGCITTGIILLAKHRGRKKAVPILLLVFCSLAAVTSVTPASVSGGIDVMTLLVVFGLAVPAIILLSKALNREARPPGFR